MRTDAEIVARIAEIEKRDFLGFEQNDLIAALTFEAAKPYLIEDATAEQFGEPVPRDKESVLKIMLDYMPFAWEKANNGRGISAARSMSHYTSWIWLAGDDLGNLNNYQFYGKDNLVKICDHYGWDHKQWDDGVREN
jgi:hypothetical protein